MKYIFILFGIALMLTDCTTRLETADLNLIKDNVIKTDIAFSKLSEDSGYQKAFIAYADENMIKLNPRRYATFGRQELVREFQEEQAKETDTSASVMKSLPPVLTWKPLHVVVAGSGDLASAFGDWEMKTILPNNKDTVLHGNYMTVWKKQIDGGWKFILDGGNPTPGSTDIKLLDKIKGD